MKVPFLAWKEEGADDFIMEAGLVKVATDDEGTIRLRKALLAYTLFKISGERTDEGFTLHEILESDITTDSKANSIIDKFKRPAIIEDSILGKLTLDQASYVYKGTLKLGISVINISVSSKECLPAAHELLSEFAELLTGAIAFAARELPKLKKPEYLWIRALDVLENNDYALIFHYDNDKYSDNCYVEKNALVSGNVKTGFKSAKLY